MDRPINQQFQTDPRLTAIAIAYRNPDYALIADQVLPRITVAAKDFKFTAHDESEMFSVPDTRVGRRSAPNRVELEGKEVPASCEDFGIDIPLDNDAIDQATKAGYDPRARATERSTSIVELDREIRVARMVCDPASYHADNRLALAGGDGFSSADSDPLVVVQSMMDGCWMPVNQLTFGHSAWNAFRSHPKVVKAVNRNSGDSGMATREQIASLFEVQRVLVGAGRVNVAKPGLAPVMERVWGNIVSGQFIDRSVSAETGGITFGFTAQYGKRIAGAMPANVGLRGGVLVRAGETVRELVVARRAGFLIQNAA